MSSGAEEGRTNVYVLPLTKETLLVVSILIMFKNRKLNWNWAQDMLGNVLDVKTMEEDVKSIAVSGCWQQGGWF